MSASSNGIVASLARGLIGNRIVFSVIFFVVTVMFGFSASNIKLDPGFLKLLPVKHEYMVTMMEYLDDFSGSNRVLVSMRWTGEDEIYNPEFFKAFENATQDVFFIPGIDRTKVSSLFTPDTYYIEVTEDGFRGEPVVPKRYSGTLEQLKQIRSNVENSGQLGLLVSGSHKAALIRADLQYFDRSKAEEAQEINVEPCEVMDPSKIKGGQRVDYMLVNRKLEELRGRFENPKLFEFRLTKDCGALAAGTVVKTTPRDRKEGLDNSLDVNNLIEGFGPFASLQKSEEGYPYLISPADIEIVEVANPDYSEHIEVNIIGFAKLLGDVINGLLGVFAFFALAFGITILLLYLYTGSLKITLTSLFVASLPVFWLIGSLPLMGLGIDPMSILVPFLIFAIGVSHAVQMTNAWLIEAAAGHDSKVASQNAFIRQFIPGTVALLTEALGFGVIMLIQIPIVQELGQTACMGVLLMIITNKMILPIVLSYMSPPAKLVAAAEGGNKKDGFGPKLWDFMGGFADRKRALLVFLFAFMLMGWATWQSRDLVIGDSGVGAPELHPDARYNIDSGTISDMYDIGADVLSVIIEAPDFPGDSCLNYPVINLIDRFELFTRGVEGVQSVVSVGSVGKRVIAAFNEGHPAWRSLPRSSVALTTASPAFAPALGFNTEGCRSVQVVIFTQDHEGPTIVHVLKEIKQFIADNPVDGVKIRLAAGNIGVMGATNEEVMDAEVTMLSCLFIALVLFCLISFRSLTALMCVLVPLVGVTVMGNALMATLGIGLKVATLPVIALGVGVGVDYGIYLFERIQHYMADPNMPFKEAFRLSMHDTGSPIVFTAATMAIGVATWTLSDLKYQADMGLLLAFLFLVNMFAATTLLPALGAWFYRKRDKEIEARMAS